MTNVETERKFLVDLSLIDLPTQFANIVQHYVPSVSGFSTRIRCTERDGLCTYYITHKSEQCTETRHEQEFEIVDRVFFALESIAVSSIAKRRYIMIVDDLRWELDVFDDGSAIAEVEINYPSDNIFLPHWVTIEVTGDQTYYNQNLAKRRV